jgi:hypothetical protein
MVLDLLDLYLDPVHHGSLYCESVQLGRLLIVPVVPLLLVW